MRREYPTTSAAKIEASLRSIRSLIRQPRLELSLEYMTEPNLTREPV
jgi:hypothetical protein